VAAILVQSSRLQDALNNPQAFIDQVAGAINDTKRILLVDGVQYLKVEGAVYEMHRFQADDLMKFFEANIVAVHPRRRRALANSIATAMIVS
jgi:type III restriction enzyme